MNQMVINLLASKRVSRGVKYQFGVRSPRNIKEAYTLDKANGNTLWINNTEKEVKLLQDDLECFYVA